jgi:DNA-3-methyladenine glycosylase
MREKRLTRTFYRQSSLTLAKGLLGKYLHRVYAGTMLVGKIVETEAYGMRDPASHSFKGRTPRTEVMFGDGGFSYVYFTYGMHHCFNVTGSVEGNAEAVLIRAVEPIAGRGVMQTLRGALKREQDLTNGPGKLCQAFGITRQENRIDLVDSEELYLTTGEQVPDSEIANSTRIGISVAMEEPWRFFIKNNPYVSKGKPSRTKL